MAGMKPRTKRIAPDKHVAIQAQADEIAALLGVAPEEVMVDSHGVSLSVSQGAALIAMARKGAQA